MGLLLERGNGADFQGNLDPRRSCTGMQGPVVLCVHRGLCSPGGWDMVFVSV